ncbi:unnamed protein product (mitochondrion) [Plasmodiophora brassicae]|uniref:60S ribosomal export protein NMD3 n=1 Tax=Plasmodiophora brassicae TaxID=37360 RepID=A0A0G4ISX7_PLABS|nr:hypothetical protein PBRA_006572 [Plasmodiophora brassicae]SPQ94543.1 unnamed protein product [Plasmodiophora brassicae]
MAASTPVTTLPTYQEHVGHILCCTCGTSILPNAANMCGDCLRSQVDLSAMLNKQTTVVFCRECQRYQKGTMWAPMELESADLLSLCLKRIKGLEKLKLIDAGFVWTEPHSRRLKVKLTVQSSVPQLNDVIVQQTLTIEIVVTLQQCEDCQRSYTEHVWKACVQVRQKADHKRTFLLLEQLILKHGMNQIIQYVKSSPGGLDLFFSSRPKALTMLDFVQSVVPARSKQSKRLISQDFKSNVVNYKFTMLAEIVPICKLDLVCLPRPVANACGGISPLLVCTKVSTTLSFIDPATLQTMDLSSSKFFASPFRAIRSAQQLVEYTVLDVVPVKVGPKFTLAEVTCARSADLGVNDTVFETVTHLGHLLKPGDLAAGYDLTTAVFNDDDVKAFGTKAAWPDVVLVKKTYVRKNRARRRRFKLARLEKSAPVGDDVDNDDAMTDAGGHQGEGDAERDEEMFLRDLEEDLELRCRVNLFKRDDVDPTAAASNTDYDDDDPEFPDVSLDELCHDLGQMSTNAPAVHDDGSDDDDAVGEKRRQR